MKLKNCENYNFSQSAQLTRWEKREVYMFKTASYPLAEAKISFPDNFLISITSRIVLFPSLSLSFLFPPKIIKKPYGSIITELLGQGMLSTGPNFAMFFKKWNGGQKSLKAQKLPFLGIQLCWGKRKQLVHWWKKPVLLFKHWELLRFVMFSWHYVKSLVKC